jgi:prophage tail gpP-like protein
MILPLFPNPHAVINVDGVDYKEWTSVSVRLAIDDPPPGTFTFTCSEQEPMEDTWAAMRIAPTEHCTISLDGEQVISGEVLTRQVYYDANQHSVQIQGADQSTRAWTMPAVSNNHEFLKQDTASIAKSLGGKIGVPVTGQGGSQKFDRASVTPGETMGEMLEKLCRNSGTHYMATPDGQLKLFQGLIGGGPTVVEGINILTAREIIHSNLGSQGNTALNQGIGGDDKNYAEENTRNATSQSSDQTGTNVAGSLKRVLGEMPLLNQAMAQARAGHESNAADANLIYVTITVLGWRTGNGSGSLWQPGMAVVVNSPMLILNGTVLGLKAVTFTQDDTGVTQSSLELVNPNAFGKGEAGL